MAQAIAIVGMACRYPDARSPDELWENALAQRRAFRRIPAERLNLNDYLSSDRESPDQTYSTQGAFIEGYEFDRVRFRVPGETYRAADPVHWMTLDVAAAALEDAGFAEGEGLPRETTGVFVGTTGSGPTAPAWNSATAYATGEAVSFGGVKYVAVTANTMPHQVASYRAAGMDEVVAKPLSVPELFAAIMTAVAVAEDGDQPIRAIS